MKVAVFTILTPPTTTTVLEELPVMAIDAAGTFYLVGDGSLFTRIL